MCNCEYCVFYYPWALYLLIEKSISEVVLKHIRSLNMYTSLLAAILFVVAIPVGHYLLKLILPGGDSDPN